MRKLARPLPLVVFTLAAAMPAAAELKTEAVEYAQGDTKLQGFFAWDDAATGKRPGVVIVHEWWGHNEHARNQAKRAAEAGYVGFALDMYGVGKVTTHAAEAEAFMNQAVEKPEVLKARFLAALERLKQHPAVDPERVAAFGYCFGGAVVLNMAGQGLPLDAAVSFHGALGAVQAPAQGAVKARVLVVNGAEDPLVTQEQVQAFAANMQAAGARYEIVNLEGVKHSFTNPHAAHAGMEALAYDEAADKKSWAKALELLKQAFGG